MDLAGVGVGVGEGALAVGADALRKAVLRVEVENLHGEERKEMEFVSLENDENTLRNDKI